MQLQLLLLATANRAATLKMIEGAAMDDLTISNSTFAYLFGVETVTDTMNSLEGPALAQVFEDGPNLYPSVIANLTNGRLVATLRNVRVKANPYFGIAAYTLEQIVIVANQPSKEFFAAFEDKAIPQKLDKRWPASFPLGLPPLDANMLCVFQGWKLKRLEGLVREVLS